MVYPIRRMTIPQTSFFISVLLFSRFFNFCRFHEQPGGEASGKGVEDSTAFSSFMGGTPATFFFLETYLDYPCHHNQ